MMSFSLCLALVVASQNPVVPPNGSPARIGQVVALAASVVATDPASLREFAALVVAAKSGNGERQQRRYTELVAAGKLIDLDLPVRVRVDQIIADNSKCILVGSMLNGSSPGPVIAFFATSHDDLLTVAASTPSSSTDSQANIAARNERDKGIYREARTMRNAARAKGAAVALSLRAGVIAREEGRIAPTLAKRYYLKIDEVRAIIAHGEQLDGTAAKRAHARASAEQREQNSEQLMMFDQVLGTQMSQALANASRANMLADAASARDRASAALAGRGPLLQVPLLGSHPVSRPGYTEMNPNSGMIRNGMANP